MRPLRLTITGLAFVALSARGLELSARGAGPRLSIQRDGSNVVLKFSTLLQSATHPEGPYTNVIGATSPYLWPVSAAPERFWRSATAGGETFSAGDNFSVALKADGGLRSWGWNDSGQLGTPGDGDWISVACGHTQTLALKAGGTLWFWGNQLGLLSTNQPAQIGSDTDWAR